MTGYVIEIKIDDTILYVRYNRLAKDWDFTDAMREAEVFEAKEEAETMAKEMTYTNGEKYRIIETKE